jgi:hypothetical protein
VIVSEELLRTMLEEIPVDGGFIGFSQVIILTHQLKTFSRL